METSFYEILPIGRPANKKESIFSMMNQVGIEKSATRTKFTTLSEPNNPTHTYQNLHYNQYKIRTRKKMVKKGL